jgi:predicted AAA+ superfamily ATPase
MMIPRQRHLARVEELLTHHPVVAILGARQVGKTTLARMLAKSYQGSVTRFDLEDLDDLARLDEPKLALAHLKGLVIIDEVQRRPDLFAVLRVLVDRPDHDARFLILGSASPLLLRQSSESLAGRIVYHDLGGFQIEEVGWDLNEQLWLRGGFPRSFLAASEKVSADWRHAFIQSFLERDISQLGIQIPSTTLHRFWRMLAHYHGQVWNGAELARAFGVSATTVRRYLDLLTGALVVYQLQPWYENLKKRQVKSPKVYISDSGLLHSLLGIESQEDLQFHPKVGASWEGFILKELQLRLASRKEESYFWASHSGAELDLLFVKGKYRLGFEFKRTTSPSLTRSMRSAMESLKLDKLYLIHAGEHTFPIATDVEAIAFADLDLVVPRRSQ